MGSITSALVLAPSGFFGAVIPVAPLDMEHTQEKSGVSESMIVVDNKLEVGGTRTICGKSGCNDKDGTDPKEFPTVIVSENDVVEPMPIEDDEVDEIVIAIQFEGDAEDSVATLNIFQIIVFSLFLFIMH